MAQEGTDAKFLALAQDPQATGELTPATSSTPVLQRPGQNPRPRKKGRPPLAPSPISALPTPTLTTGSRTSSEASMEPEARKETPIERHKRLVAESRIALIRRFPNLCNHEWLLKEIRDILNNHSLGNVISFAATTFGKTRFPKWADQVDGSLQPSLAEMLAYFGCREVLSHMTHDRFRCVVAEQHIVEKIDALLLRSKLDPEEMKDLHWPELPFNIVNGDANVDLRPRETPEPPPTPSERAEHFQAYGGVTGTVQVMKREAPGEQGLYDGLPTAKRPRTAKDDGAFVSSFREEARSVMCDALETLQESLNESNRISESEIVETVNQALETLAKDIPSKLDSSLEIFGVNLKQQMIVQIQETVKSGINEALSNRESSTEEQIATRFAKLEETLREEIRNIPSQEGQPQGYPVYYMPSVPLQMPQMSQVANMGGMGQQMIQGPALGGYVQTAPSPRNMKLSRDGHLGNFAGRRPS